MRIAASEGAVVTRLGELAGVVDLLSSVADLEDLELFPDVVLPRMGAIVPCEVSTYNEVNTQTATMRLAAYPSEAVGCLGGKNALNREVATTLRCVPRDEEYCRLFYIVSSAASCRSCTASKACPRFQVSLSLCGPDRRVMAIAMNRDSHDFTARERALVALLHAPLTASAHRLGRRLIPLDRFPDGDDLTGRERQVLELLASGRTDRAIARLLGCSQRTISKHLQNIYRKLGVTGRVAATTLLHNLPGGFASARRDWRTPL